MTDIGFDYENCLVPKKELDKIQKKLQKEIKLMNEATKNGYDDDRCSINLPNDKENLKTAEKLIEEKKGLEPYYLVIAGIGGSNLGTIAVQQAVFGKLHNQLRPSTKIIYADTVDEDTMGHVNHIIERALKRGDSVIINGVSKSGGTTETIANFEVLVDILKKYRKEYHQFIIVTTDKESKLWHFAKKIQFGIFDLPPKGGGRAAEF